MGKESGLGEENVTNERQSRCGSRAARRGAARRGAAFLLKSRARRGGAAWRAAWRAFRKLDRAQRGRRAAARAQRRNGHSRAQEVARLLEGLHLREEDVDDLLGLRGDRTRGGRGKHRWRGGSRGAGRRGRGVGAGWVQEEGGRVSGRVWAAQAGRVGPRRNCNIKLLSVDLPYLSAPEDRKRARGAPRGGPGAQQRAKGRGGPGCGAGRRGAVRGGGE